VTALLRPFSALALLLSLAAAARAPAPFWQKSWTISGVVGRSAAATPVAAEIGAPVVLTADRARTPYSTECAGKPDYRDVRARPRRELARYFGPHWKFPTALGARPVAGWVRCPGGGNIGAFAFTDARQGYYFFEEGLVLTLR
jgi:hypothetical protein